MQLRDDALGDRFVFGGHGPEDQSLDSPTGAMLLVVFLVPITLLFHGDVGDSGQRIQLLNNLAIIGGLLLVADQDSRGRVGFAGTEKFSERHCHRFRKQGNTPRFRFFCVLLQGLVRSYRELILKVKLRGEFSIFPRCFLPF